MRRRSLLALGLVASCLLMTFALAVDITEFEQAQGKTYGPEYFYAIEGEIVGQAAPGVEAVFVNGLPVPVDVDLTFQSKIFLKKDQKYLTIETRYKGLTFIKKYLVIRHPKVTAPFKINVPKQEFEEIIKTKSVSPVLVEQPPAPKQKPVRAQAPRLKPAVKRWARPPQPVSKPPATEPMIEDWLGYQFVAELSPGKLLVVRKIDSKYYGLLYDKATGAWARLDDVSLRQFKELLK